MDIDNAELGDGKEKADEKADLSDKSIDSLNGIGLINVYSTDADKINDCAEMDVNGVNAMVNKSSEPSIAVGNMEQADHELDNVGTIDLMNTINNADKSSGATSSDGGDGRHGHIGRSVAFDPFMRTRNVPFRIAGRRRSISVFSTIHENEIN